MSQPFDGDSRILYVPVETQAREYDAKLLLCLTALRANFQVVFGPKWLLLTNLGRLPRGLFGFKTLNRMDAVLMPAAIQRGHAVIGWDEEGPGQIVPEIYLKSIDADAVRHAHRIFAWGDHQAKVLAGQFPEAAGKIEAAGNPRGDILRPEYRSCFAEEAQAIRAKYGRFILVNTNFSTYNACFEEGAGVISKIAQATGALKDGDTGGQDLLARIHTFEQGTFESYAAVLPALGSAFPDHTIIVRPHPTEQHDRWREICAPFANVRAVYEGTVVPWIMAAEAVVQNSCTTGIEAVMLNKPVVSYCKYDTPALEWHLANQVCPRVHSETALVEFLQRFIADPAGFTAFNAPRQKVLNHHIAKLSGESSSAAIVKSLIFLAKRSEKAGIQFDRAYPFGKALEGYRKTDYMELKFPEVSGEQLQQRIVRLSRSVAVPAAEATPIAASCFLFRRK